MESGEQNIDSERKGRQRVGATVGITSLVCSAYLNRRGSDLLGIFSRDNLLSFDPIIRFGVSHKNARRLRHTLLASKNSSAISRALLQWAE